jgi:hypothetical protein
MKYAGSMYSDVRWMEMEAIEKRRWSSGLRLFTLRELGHFQPISGDYCS